MFSNAEFLVRQIQSGLQSVAFVVIAVVTGVLLAASILAGMGQIPWPQLALSFGGVPVVHAGIYAQLGLTALLVMLCFFLPANARMTKLEKTHRNFQIGMEDVKRAYALAHAEDRRGVFSLSSEFKSMRQRMELLRKHPDLHQLEPELLELAAQMSHEARDLARAYSDEKVARAKGFLKSRQEETEMLQDRIKLARMTCDELRRWLQDIEATERQNHDQIRRLEADLKEVLPALGYDFDEGRDANVVALPKANAKTDGLH